MIVGIGIDLVDITRFAQWHTWPLKKLQRLFSVNEIEYCLRSTDAAAQRFAARFAAREALYKAVCSAGAVKPAFFTLCSNMSIIGHPPHIVMQQEFVEQIFGTGRSLKFHLSLTHANQCAGAVVIIEKTA